MQAGSPKTELLIFAADYNDAIAGVLIQAGVRGFVLKSEANKELIAAVDAVAAHTAYFSARLSLPTRGHSVRRNDAPCGLTQRKAQVLRLIAEGHSNKSVARLLNISLKTVETHRAAVMRKLGLSSNSALVRYAVRNKLIAP
jgi:DNA-binding NarL/FixJ family response regulator